jgi:hypothetical protein
MNILPLCCSKYSIFLTAAQQHGMDSIRTWKMVDGGVGTENLISHCYDVPKLPHMLLTVPRRALEFLLR